MKIIVAVKHVVDYLVPVRAAADEQSVTDSGKWAINPFDEIAVQAAVDFKAHVEKQSLQRGVEIIIVSIGDKRCIKSLRWALAMGGQRGVWVDYDRPLDTLATAKILEKIVTSEQADLIFLGKQAIDSDACQTGQMLAQRLNAAQATHASNVGLNKTANTVLVDREIDGGTEQRELEFPAVITADLRLAEPIVPRLSAVLQARAKPLKQYIADDFNLDLTPRLRVLSYQNPPPRQRGVMLNDTTQLARQITVLLSDHVPPKAEIKNRLPNALADDKNTVLVIIMPQRGVAPPLAELIGTAQQLSQAITVLVIGEHIQTVAKHATQYAGVKAVLTADTPRLAHHCAEMVSPLITQVIHSAQPAFTHCFIDADVAGKAVLPRVAAALDTIQISEVCRIVDEKTFEHYRYTGNILATVQSHEAVKLLTLRSHFFAKAHPTLPADKRQTISVTPLDSADLEQLDKSDNSDITPRSRVLSRQPTPRLSTALSAAEVVIGGGRGFRSAKDFTELLTPLANSLGAAIGATRPPVDAGFCPPDCQIGQTGKSIAAKLYLAIGVSGTFQHLAGLQKAQTIIAINSDPNAPIFSVCDYGLVADLYEVLPQLTRLLTAENFTNTASYVD